MSFARDYRYQAARDTRRRFGKAGLALMGSSLRDFRRKKLESLHLQVNDQVCYDFGGKILDLRVTAIDGFRIVTQDAEGRVFRFGGIDAFAPGVWEGNHSTVSAELFKR